ncbi:MAG: GNAT family N-acetyltransferase [Acidiphilium sp.]
MTVIRTLRLRLRRASDADLDALHAIMTDPETMRYWSTTPHADRGVTRAFLDRMREDGRDEFAIEYNDALIGKVGVWQARELGFILGRAHWGKGLAHEAARAFIDYRFAAGTDHLTAEADPENLASLALLGRLGFIETGRAARTWLVGDKWSDSVYLRLDRPLQRTISA